MSENIQLSDEENNQNNNESAKPSFLKRFIDWVNGEEDFCPPKPIEFSPLDIYELQKRLRKKLLIIGTHNKNRLYNLLCVVACITFIGILLATVFNLPSFGSGTNPASNEVVKRYLEKGMEETGAVNIVAAVILDYRAFDTFGESAVLFLSVICVMMLLQRDKNNISPEYDREMEEDEQFDKERNDIVLKRVAALLVPLIFLYGIYVILNGHLTPGGGFSGGTIIGAGLILYSSAYGHKRVHAFFNINTFTYISVGCLLTYCGAKGYSFFTGANHIESHIPKGIAGNILSAGLILPLNICVGMIVACTMYGFYALFTKGEI